MNVFESFLVELLQGRIHVAGEVVEVRRTFLPSAVLPCITLGVVGDTTDYTYRTYENKETQFAYRSSEITINTWCNTEEQRELINEQVMECFVTALNHDYTYCTNYDDGCCTPLRQQCKALTVTNSRTVKRQCPDPDLYEYESLFTKHGLVDGKCIIEPPFYSDEPNEKPPILHSIFRCRTDYIEQLWKMGEKNRGRTYDDITIQ